MSKIAHVVNITLEPNSSITRIKEDLDPGKYSRIQVINRNSQEPSQPVEIEITDASNTDVISLMSVKALESGNGNFFESKAPFKIQRTNGINIRLQAASQLDNYGARYQIIFWKDLSCNTLN